MTRREPYIPMMIVAGDVLAMDRTREIAAAATPSLNAYSFSFPFIFFEGYAVITNDTIRNVFVALIAVWFICMILLSNITLSFIVALMVALVDVALFGTLYFLNLTFDSVVSINLVLAIGLSVDSSAHVAHAFMTVEGTRDERVHKALEKLGGSVFCGGITTFLAVVPLAGAKSYIFRTFFQMYVH